MIKHELLKIYVWFNVTLCCAWFFLNVNLEPKIWSNDLAVWALDRYQLLRHARSLRVATVSQKALIVV